MPCGNEHDAGVTDLMAECLLKGTSTRSAADIARFLEDIGGAVNTSTGNNSLSVGCQVLAEDLDAGLELMADVVMNPSFPEDAFLREKESFVADAEEDMEDPLPWRSGRSGRWLTGMFPMGIPLPARRKACLH